MSIFVELDGRRFRVDLPSADTTSSGPPAWKVSEGEKPPALLEADVLPIDSSTVSILYEGRSVTATLDTFAGETTVLVQGVRYPVALFDPRSLAARRGLAAAADGAVTIKSPMPGRVVRVLGQPGDTVAAKQGILVVEAMKMQNELKAPRAGRIGSILVAAGDTVAANQPLATIV